MCYVLKQTDIILLDSRIVGSQDVRTVTKATQQFIYVTAFQSKLTSTQNSRQYFNGRDIFIHRVMDFLSL